MNQNLLNMGLKDGNHYLFPYLGWEDEFEFDFIQVFHWDSLNPEQQWHRNTQIFLQSTLKTQEI